MGGLWSDALGERGDERAAGIEHRCIELLRDVDITMHEQARAKADHVPPPTPDEAYFPMRAVEPHIVDGISQAVAARAGMNPDEKAQRTDLEHLLRALAAATRETIHARRAADVVKNDVLGEPASETYAADKIQAASALESHGGIDALFQLEAGLYTDEARALGLLVALDRMEIARGLPKHLKIYVVAAAYSNVFGVPAPNVRPLPDKPIPSGTWVTYLADVAAAAGHPVPTDAHAPQNREPLAWAGVQAGFADRLRSGVVRAGAMPPLTDVERSVIARLDEQTSGLREAYEAHAAKDR